MIESRHAIVIPYVDGERSYRCFSIDVPTNDASRVSRKSSLLIARIYNVANAGNANPQSNKV